MVLCIVSGNSLGFREVGVLGWIIAHSETLNVHFSGCGVGAYMDMGKPWGLSGALELFRLFRDIGKLGEVVLRVWKPRLYTFVKLRGAFREIWKLRGGRFKCVETWHACTYETFGVHSRFV